MLAVSLLWRSSSPLWVCVGMVSLVGAVAGTLPLDHEIFPRVSGHDLLRQAAIGSLQRFLFLFVFLGGAALMPDEFSRATWIIAGVVIGIGFLWSRGGWIWLGRKMGLFRPAPDRLTRIATETSIKMKIPFRDVLVMRVSLAQALAVLDTRTLLFTERLLEISPDDELAAICAHELAHLTESKVARYSRSVQLLTFLPWLFFNPLIHLWGMIGLFALCGLSMAAPRIHRIISRKLESRADQMAKGSEGDTGTYASALTRLYEDNLLPAVLSKRTTHPDLYDRILDAGVTPDFARPEAAKAMAWNGTMFALLLGGLLVVLAVRTIVAVK